MSRIGRLPIDIPTGVEISVNDDVVTVQGRMGELTTRIAQPIEVVSAYKGKGVRYAGEQIRRKAGKAGK